MKPVIMPPDAATLMWSTRAIGYTTPSAIADLIDNSISANASIIQIEFVACEDSYVAILDDGKGMNPGELQLAMKYGSGNPLAARAESDLGRFGLGLKTASLSQCRKLTVISKKEGRLSAYCWDLDHIFAVQAWELLELSNEEIQPLPHVEKLSQMKEGTIVIWNKLDKMCAGDEDKEKGFLIRIREVEAHLSLTFHRFLQGEPGTKKLSIYSNGILLQPTDPFYISKSDIMPSEKIPVTYLTSLHQEQIAYVTVTPYILPFSDSLSQEELNSLGGKDGLIRNQGFYCNSIPEFIKDPSANIIGQLVKHSFEINKDQSDAWENQIQQLQKRLEACGMEGDIIFEYDIIRLGKRIDVILLIRHMVFSLEFKNGKVRFEAQDAQQAEDYAIDIKNFHKESEDLYVCPILIATEAPKYNKVQSTDCYPDKQIHLQRENIETLIPKVAELTGLYGSDEIIDFQKWFNSPYHPTPTIIAAAVEAYTTHDISEIANSEAGQSDIDACEDEIGRIVEYAQTNKKKCVCFVTGVPGAGKTLVGLDVVAKNMHKGADNLSVYLSGNGPLVEVLREALKKSVKEKKQLNRNTEAAINALIQSSFAFKKDNVRTVNPTAEKILIFDEAQRVWNEQKMTSKHQNDPEMSVSEPKLLYQIMDRHQDWAVMICLVGLGQDIYDGEVGINEWFRCGVEEFQKWEMFYSPAIFQQTEDKDIDEQMIRNCPRCHARSSLHLKTSIRSFRADEQCKFVDYLLDNQPKEASRVYSKIFSKYHVYITRDIKAAKSWARGQVRGSQRCGVLASSSAQRLKPEGIYVPTDIDVKNWFLAPSDDLRSSNMMEVVASEFKVQGLEIDWAVVCWDADLRRKKDNDWDHYSFRGTKWTRRNKAEQKRYLVNSYRVLLTRARQGMVVFVPKGTDPEDDPTRDKIFYDSIYNYLISCGIKELPV